MNPCRICATEPQFTANIVRKKPELNRDKTIDTYDAYRSVAACDQFGGFYRQSRSERCNGKIKPTERPRILTYISF
jgi:hypothetical protein